MDGPGENAQVSLIPDEARLLINRLLDPELLDSTIGERKSAESKRRMLRQITGIYKGTICIEAICLLTRTYIISQKKTQILFEDILHHRNSMVMPPLTPSIKKTVFSLQEKGRIPAPGTTCQTGRKGGNHESVCA